MKTTMAGLVLMSAEAPIRSGTALVRRDLDQYAAFVALNVGVALAHAGLGGIDLAALSSGV